MTETHPPQPTQSAPDSTAASRLYSVRLVTVDPKFYCPTVIAINSVTQLGLKQSIDVVRAAPITFKMDLDLGAATAVKEKVTAGVFPLTPRDRKRKKLKGFSDSDSWPRPAAGEKCCTVEILEQSAATLGCRSSADLLSAPRSQGADAGTVTP